jgi:hypothetical protein
MSVLNESIVLELNANWQRTKWKSVQEALKSLAVDNSGIPNMLVIPVGPDGIEGHPITLDEWMKLPVREFDDKAVLTKSGAIRAPLVIIAPGYGDMPVKEPILTKEAIFARDGFVDQYTGEKLSRQDASIDHVIPKDVWNKRGLRGSPERWDNVVTCKKKLNHNKGNKTNFQAGMRLMKKPKAPKRVPVHFLINAPRHPFQRPFFE